jgi:hypothetical protein
VLSSKRAVEVNIQIIRAFVQLRQILSSEEQFRRKLATLERKLTEHDAKLISVFEAIRQLMAPLPQGDKRQIGFVQPPKKNSIFFLDLRSGAGPCSGIWSGNHTPRENLAPRS